LPHLPINCQVAASSTKQVLMARALKRKIVGMFFFFLMLAGGLINCAIIYIAKGS
jgi:hypothetical protein